MLIGICTSEGCLNYHRVLVSAAPTLDRRKSGFYLPDLCIAI